VRQVERSGRRCLLRVRSQAEEINETFGSPEAVPADRPPVDMPNDIISRVVGVNLRWKDLAEHEHRYMGSGSRSDVVDRREWVWSA
jgi:hypothetical protein